MHRSFVLEDQQIVVLVLKYQLLGVFDLDHQSKIGWDGPSPSESAVGAWRGESGRLELCRTLYVWAVQINERSLFSLQARILVLHRLISSAVQYTHERLGPIMTSMYGIRSSSSTSR
jgi:hypothetical protein